MLASLLDVSHVGYPLLFLMVMAESSGALVPGETALITASVLASQGKLKIELVIALAASAAIVGDNIGYVIGRKGGRWVLERPGRFYRQRLEVLRVGEPFFERHGPKAVFFGRFLLGLRVWASWPRALGSRGLRLALGLALDHRSSAADADRHAAGLALLGLRHPHLEHALVEARLDAVGVDALGQRERSRKAPRRPLQPVQALLALLVLGLALARDREDVVLQLHVYLVLAHAGQTSA